ncbi:MAG TPA: RbsD/FucU domain-containing protein [Phycisphaerae bacterium]|nr:RbsD/FucU domain-containing protein [Phycisphaerae bacterium]
MANWKQKLADELPLLGHRNWIVVADAAYPAQSHTGIETVATNAGQIEVVQSVLAALDGTRHVRPVIYLDAELPHVPEQFAPGIGQYRQALDKALGSRPVTSLPHEEIITRLDRTGGLFRVLILKTNLTLPYTSVFLQLDCGYWSDAAEQALRSRFKAARCGSAEAQ